MYAFVYYRGLLWQCVFVYSRNGSRFSVVREDEGVPRREPGVEGAPLSDASEGFRNSRDTAVCWPDRTGVVLPDGVLCLLQNQILVSILYITDHAPSIMNKQQLQIPLNYSIYNYPYKNTVKTIKANNNKHNCIKKYF